MLSPHRSFAFPSIYIETVRRETGDDTDLKTANPAALALKTAVICDVIRWRLMDTDLSGIVLHSNSRYGTVEKTTTMSFEI